MTASSTRVLLQCLVIVLATIAVAAIGWDRLPLIHGNAPAERRTSVVTQVIDGDTVDIAGIGRSRLVGVDTPEVNGRRECFGPEASAYAKRMLRGRGISYRVARDPRDRYGRSLVYLWLRDGQFFNAMLIEGGYALPLSIAPNVEFADRFMRLAGEARAERRGLWDRRKCP